MKEEVIICTYSPFERTNYQLNDVLTDEERAALSTGYRRSDALN